MKKEYKQFKKILVPIEGSAFSEKASAYAARLATNQDIELTLLHVSSAEKHDPEEMGRGYLYRRSEALHTAVKEKARPDAPEPRITAELLAGRPADEILNTIRQKGIDLVIMATHGRSGISSLVMGSVANRVVRESEVPVLLVKAGADKKKNEGENPAGRILVPLDGSKLGEYALPIVQAFVRQFGSGQSEVVLLSVCEPSPVKSGYPLLLDGERAAAMKAFKHALQAEEYLVELTASMRSAGIKATADTIGGNPAAEIIKQAEDKKVNLIAMATHGRSGITSIAYGSVAEAVIHGISTPILLVRPQ